ncbi:MAG: DUF1015 domain-containing protein [Flavobacteriales bacterium]|nr:DUF1015 domain-containing protein [Flavobacteriales bacterium]MCB9336281.1 DUF1015 domain-containing protein [Flavobacteriales bacterium]
MAKIVPFKAIRPTRDKAYLVSSMPAYIYPKHLLEAKLESNPYTFLHVINPEFRADNKTQPNTVERFQNVREKFDEFNNEGIFIQDSKESFYIYRQITKTNTYVGLISGISVDDYLNGNIKIHEHTLTQREETFKLYLDVCQFNAEPVLLTYEDNPTVDTIINKYINTRSEYEFCTTHHIKQDLWLVNDENDISTLVEAFKNIKSIYIADGHHRSASSVLYAQSKREENPNYDKESKFNYFLSYLIPESKLNIIEYNRTVSSLNEHTPESFIEEVSKSFEIDEKMTTYSPIKKHNFSMYLAGKWYSLTAKKGTYNEDDIVGNLDARILTENILKPILGIKDLKTDNRIEFMEGTRGAEGLQMKVDNEEAIVAFGLYPVSIEQLKAVADANNIMPPKSTWIEPKMRSGLTIYSLED